MSNPFNKSHSLTSGKNTDCECVSRHRYKDRSIPAKNRLYGDYKRGAKVRKLEFLLSFEEFSKLTSSVCFYCGSAPSNIRKDNIKSINPCVYVYNGIDRKNNSEGYTIANCIPCCSSCNFAKATHTFVEFIFWTSRIKNNVDNIKLKLLGLNPKLIIS